MAAVQTQGHAAQFLQAEHRLIDEGFALYFVERSEARWGDMLTDTLRNLKVHLELEEELLYPHLARKNDESHYHESLVVHEVFKKLIGDIEHSDPANLQYEAMVRVLWKMVARHFVEEEGVNGVLSLQPAMRPDFVERLRQRRDELADGLTSVHFRGVRPTR